MTIYPKIDPGNVPEMMKKIILQSQGVEIQFFDQNGITSEFDFEETIRKRKAEFPNLEEIIIHPPLNDYNFEILILKNKKIIEKQLHTLVNLSEELGISLGFIYHTALPKRQYISTGLDKRLRSLLKIIENTRVTILFENIFMVLEERVGCEVLEICKYIDHPNLRMCLDTTHLHCKSNIWKIDFKEMLEQDFNYLDCEKYVKQIHFAAALNNDGYIDKNKTHGRKHENIETLKSEANWLKKYGMLDKTFVTEVSEEDYFTRIDQIEEITMLKNI